ncbi:MAG: hypothetical protein ACOYMF_14310 [Bacteroidales bacterium]
MKKSFSLLLILSVILSGCNISRSMTDLTQNERVKYKLQPTPNNFTPDYYFYTAPGVTKENAATYRKLASALADANYKLNSASADSLEYDTYTVKLLEKQLSEIPKDSTRNYIVSFTDNIKGVDYAIIGTFWWDYSNWRVLVPFLPMFNRWHLYNQCVNKAMDKCLQYTCDGVIIAGDYSTFKLFIIK